MLDDLPLSWELSNAIERWCRVAWESEDDDLRAEGLRLLEQARTELGPRFQIVWDHD